MHRRQFRRDPLSFERAIVTDDVPVWHAMQPSSTALANRVDVRFPIAANGRVGEAGAIFPSQEARASNGTGARESFT